MACYLLLIAGVYWTSFIIKIYNYKRCGENTDRRLNKPRYQLAFYLFLCQLKTTTCITTSFILEGALLHVVARNEAIADFTRSLFSVRLLRSSQ